ERARTLVKEDPSFDELLNKLRAQIRRASEPSRPRWDDVTERARRSLEWFATQNAPLAREDVMCIVRQIADVLETAHAAGVVHGDLKPDTIMYDPESHRVDLQDFGVDVAATGAGEHHLTRAGFFIGTLLYVAPETLGGEAVTPAADQYSLAT